jgi:2-(1,2-epoxy-1,2-dihydrophenyl)acetyl-CoA isomerase
MSKSFVERKDGIVTVTFNRPEKRNALTVDEWQLLDQVTRDVGFNPRDRVLVLRGAGGNFSAGADLGGGPPVNPETGEPMGMTGGPPISILYSMRFVGELISRLQRLPKPSIALVDGAYVGVSVGLALACDLIVASDRAKFASVFIKRGLALDGGVSWSLPHQIGLRRAKQMAFFGDNVPAQTALQWGLVNEVVPADDLDRVGGEWAARLAKSATTAISLTKKELDSAFHQSFE